jgi:hypothetical protein
MEALTFIQHRNTRAAAGAKPEELAILDGHIAAILAAKPTRMGSIWVTPLGQPAFAIQCDFANDHLKDLMRKIAAYQGHHPDRWRLIFKGRHIEDHGQTLVQAGLTEDAKVNICLRLGCNGNCCEATYNGLADLRMRQVRQLSDTLSAKQIDDLLVVVSKLECKGCVPAAAKASAVEATVKACLVDPTDAWTTPVAKAAWRWSDDKASALLLAALRESGTKKPGTCEPLLACAAEPLEACAWLPKARLPTFTAEAMAEAKVMTEPKVTTEPKTPTTDIKTPIDEEDLYG